MSARLDAIPGDILDWCEGGPVTIATLSRAVGATIAETAAAASELEREGRLVADRSATPTLWSLPGCVS